MYQEQAMKEPGSLGYLRNRLAELATDLEYAQGQINGQLQQIERYSEPTEVPTDDRMVKCDSEPPLMYCQRYTQLSPVSKL